MQMIAPTLLRFPQQRQGLGGEEPLPGPRQDDLWIICYLETGESLVMRTKLAKCNVTSYTPLHDPGF